MKKFKTLFLLFLIFQIALPAQRDADWEVEVPGTIQDIVFHNLTGVPIVQTNETYAGIDPETKKIAWQFARAASKKNSGILELTTDFYEVNLTPFILVANNLLDSRDGKVILNKEEDGHKKIHDYEYIPELNSVLFRAGAGKQLRLYLVDMETGTKKWGTDVMKLPSLGQLSISSDTGESDPNARPDISVPVGTSTVTKDGYLIYRFKKNIIVVNANTGKFAWKAKTDPANVVLSPDEKVVISFEKAGGMLGVGMGKKVLAFDKESGEELWKVKTGEDVRRFKLWDDHVFLADKESCNLYSYKDGKTLWKNNYKQKRVKSVEKNGEGYMVRSGRKYMQLDESGKKMWKKPKKEAWGSNWATAGGETGGNEEPEGYFYKNGEIVVAAGSISFVPADGSLKKAWNSPMSPNARMAFDKGRNNVVVVDEKKLYVINPDTYENGSVSLKLKIRNSQEFTTLEIRDDAYFMTGPQEFVIAFPDKQESIHKYYKKPFDKKNFMSNMASAGLGAASAYNAVSGVTNSMKGAAGMATMGMTPLGDGTNEIRSAGKNFDNAEYANKASSFVPPTRKAAFAQTQDFAYYFTKEKDGKESNKLLICVNKDSGEEVDKLIFDDARPNYKIDEIERRIYYGNKSALKVFQL